MKAEDTGIDYDNLYAAFRHMRPPEADNDSTLNRRQFLKMGGLIGGGFALACIYSPVAISATATEAGTKSDSHPVTLNAFIHIRADGKIVILAKNPEIGQGVKTSLPMIVAEELDASWEDVVVQQSPVDSERFGMHLAGGSLSVSMNWDRLRYAGAVAKTMLLRTAAELWKVPFVELTAKQSYVIHTNSNRSIHYSKLADAAAKQPVPETAELTLKEPGNYTLLGKRVGGVDNERIVLGQPLFGIDVVVDDMAYAVFVKSPKSGAIPVSFNKDIILAMPGVTNAFIVPGSKDPTAVKPGIAIIGKSTWQVLRARRALNVVWDNQSASNDSWEDLKARGNAIKQRAPTRIYFEKGAAETAIQNSKQTIDAFYSFGFVAHATMEPQNCTAWYKGDSIEFWAPTQAPDWGIKQVANLLAIPAEHIKVNQTRIGGGFGRRLLNDYMCEVALIAKQLHQPVKLIWSREDDFQHDYYRPAGFNAMQAGLDEERRLVSWKNHFITLTNDEQKPVMGGGYLFPQLAQYEFPAHALQHYQHGYSMLPVKTRTGAWRAPFTNTLAWVNQSFLHEISVAAQADHLSFLLKLFGHPQWLAEGNKDTLNTERAIAVTKRVAELAGWGRESEPGRALGLAFHFCHGGHFASCADLSVDENKVIKIHRIYCVGDIGPIVNMSGAEHQCEGAVLDALSAMMEQHVEIEDGISSVDNFHKYTLLRMHQVPDVQVEFIQGQYSPTGAGEPALPPVAPAICNAIYSASQLRVRNLPLSQEGYTLA